MTMPLHRAIPYALAVPAWWSVQQLAGLLADIAGLAPWVDFQCRLVLAQLDKRKEATNA